MNDLDRIISEGCIKIFKTHFKSDERFVLSVNMARVSHSKYALKYLKLNAKVMLQMRLLFEHYSVIMVDIIDLKVGQIKFIR